MLLTRAVTRTILFRSKWKKDWNSPALSFVLLFILCKGHSLLQMYRSVSGYPVKSCHLSPFIVLCRVQVIAYIPLAMRSSIVLINQFIFSPPFDVLCFVFSLLRWFPGRISPFQVLIRFLLSLFFSPFVISLFVLLSCSVCMIPRFCAAFNR